MTFMNPYSDFFTTAFMHILNNIVKNIIRR
jgi:hypothetical protein